MFGRCIVTLAGTRLKFSVRFSPLRGMYQRGTCKGCDKEALNWSFTSTPRIFCMYCKCIGVQGSEHIGCLTVRKVRHGDQML